METFTQDFYAHYVQQTTYIQTRHKANRKERRRQRHQIQQQQHRRPPTPPPAPPAPILAQTIRPLFAPELELLAIEEAQADREDSLVALWFESPPPKKRGRPRVHAVTEHATQCTHTQMGEWFAKWRKPIRSWFRNRCSVPSGDIDDLLQEVFLRLLRYSQDKAIDNPQGYLFRIAGNVANEWRERSRNCKPHEAEWLDELVMDSSDEPEERYSQHVDRQVVEAAVGQLTARQRLCVDEHVNGELTYKQIAKKYDLTYRIVLRDLTRAYSVLRMKLPQDLMRTA